MRGLIWELNNLFHKGVSGLEEVTGKNLLLSKVRLIVLIYLLVDFVRNELSDAIEGQTYNRIVAAYRDLARADLLREGWEGNLGIRTSRYCGTIAN